jgi:glyoxylase-like metal-dependent hydrolase (beta-lactamase superfamily II)
MSSVRVVRVSILPLGMVNCHLLIGPQGCVLVDAGLPGSETKVRRVLRQHGLDYADIKLIVITHAHIDHAGAARKLAKLSGAPIVAHAGDLDYYQQKKPMTFCTTDWFSRLFLRTGLIMRPYAPFTPDVLLQDGESLDLQPYGLPGRVQHTPGHTAGSISIQMEGGDAMVGDLLASGVMLGGLLRTGRAKRPPFEDDPHQVADELQRLVDAGMQHFYMGHGGPLPAKEVQRHAQALRALPRWAVGACCDKH